MKEPNHSTRIPPPWLGGLVAALGFAMATTIPAQGASQTITSPNEAALRAAVGNGGIINLAFDGTLCLTNAITLERDITLDGSGHAVTISGRNAVRLFKVAPEVKARFINLTLADGRYVGTEGGHVSPDNVIRWDGESAYGGAIYNDGGTVDLLSCVLRSNVVKGGETSISGYSAGEASGGAVFNLAGVLNITNSSFTFNSAAGGRPTYYSLAGHGWGGAISSRDGKLNLSNVQFISNSVTGGELDPIFSNAAGNAYGGALHASGGAVMVQHSTFTGNKVSAGHGAHCDTDGRGGALNLTNALLICTDSQFLGNAAKGGNGSRYGSGEGLGGALFSQGEVSLSGCLFRANSALGPMNLATNPIHGLGKGGAAYTQGSLRATACTFDGNLAQGGIGGSIQLTPFDSGSGMGGGIYSLGTLYLTNSTLLGNRAEGGAGIQAAGGNGNGGSGLGGGLYQAAGSAVLVNVTLATNQAAGGSISYGWGAPPYAGPGLGGAFYQAEGTACLVNVTFAGNSAAGGTGPRIPAGAGLGGAIYSTNGMVWLGNTIVAYSPSGRNAFGPLNDGGHNLSSDASCNFTNTGSLNNTDPLLGPLADNGGPTFTMALLADSPAINAGDDKLAPALDQRGIRRPQGAHADMGAFEYTARAWIGQPTRMDKGWLIRFKGRRNGVYSILRAASLDGPWTPCGTATATDGLGLFVDPEPLAGTAFYRLKEE